MSEDNLQVDELTRTVRQYEMRIAHLNQSLSSYQRRLSDLHVKVQACLRLAGLPYADGEPDPLRLVDEVMRLRGQIEPTD